MSGYVIVLAEGYAYGPFEEAKAERIAEQLEASGESGVTVTELREWRDEWTETVAERIARTRRR